MKALNTPIKCNNRRVSNHLKRSELGVGFRRGGRARPLRHVSGIQKSGHNCSFLDHTALECCVCASSGWVKSVFGFHKKLGEQIPATQIPHKPVCLVF